MQTSNWPLQKIPYHTIMLLVCNPKILHKHCLQCLSWELNWPQEKLKTMLMQHFGVTNKEHYGMLWYFWNGQLFVNHARSDVWCWISPNKLNRLRIDYGHGRTLNLYLITLPPESYENRIGLYKSTLLLGSLPVSQTNTHMKCLATFILL